jgi:hypothetical protein
MVKSASVGLRDVKIHLSKYIKMAQQDTEGIAQKRLQEDR